MKMHDTFLSQEKHSNDNCVKYKHKTAKVGSTDKIQNFSKINEDFWLK